MIRALATAVLCAAAIVAADTLFRSSVLSHLRPVILSPSDQAVVEPPVRLSWDGPQPMRVLLSVAGEQQRDLGEHASPVEIGGDQFPRDGGYQIELRAPRFGNWIRASRWFQVHAAPPPAPQQDRDERAGAGKELVRALEAVRTARDRAHERTKFLNQENAALRDESERLTKQLDTLYEAQERDAERAADTEKRLSQLADENRALAEENAAMRQRLGSVIPCSVWGYYAFPLPQTFPVPRRLLMVADPRGQIFRGQPQCELVRHADITAASICFCVGNSWGG